MIFVAGYLILAAGALLFALGLCRTAAASDNDIPPGNHRQATRAADGAGHFDAGSRTGVRRPWRTAGADVGSAPATDNDDGRAATSIPARSGAARGGEV